MSDSESGTGRSVKDDESASTGGSGPQQRRWSSAGRSASVTRSDSATSAGEVSIGADNRRTAATGNSVASLFDVFHRAEGGTGGRERASGASKPVSVPTVAAELRSMCVHTTAKSCISADGSTFRCNSLHDIANRCRLRSLCRDYLQISTVAKSALATYGKHLIGGRISFEDWRVMLAGLGIMHTELRARMWYQAARAVAPPIPPTMGTMSAADRATYMNTLEPEGLPVALFIVSRVSHPEYIVSCHALAQSAYSSIGSSAAAPQYGASVARSAPSSIADSPRRLSLLSP